jgi:hypothetical protein
LAFGNLAPFALWNPRELTPSRGRITREAERYDRWHESAARAYSGSRSWSAWSERS